MKLRKRLTKKEAAYLGLIIREDGNDGSNARYMLSEDEIDAITLLKQSQEKDSVEVANKTFPSDYTKKKFVMSAWDDTILTFLK